MKRALARLALLGTIAVGTSGIGLVMASPASAMSINCGAVAGYCEVFHDNGTIEYFPI